MANFVLIPSGTLQIGTTVQRENEAFLSVQTVTIEKSFYMGKCEITQAEWKDIMGTNPSANVNPVAQGELEEKRPVEKVSWFDALVYCNKRSLLENLTPCYFINNSTNPDDWGTIPTSYKDDNYAVWNAAECNWNANGYRLPTEAEWEYAARAGDETEDTLVYSGTKNLSELINYAWYEENSDRRTHEVGKKLPNGFGLYDMSGNVSEWCWDKHSKNSPIVRSSAFNDVANRCSVSYRLYSANSEDRFYWIGLRVVRSSSN